MAREGARAEGGARAEAARVSGAEVELGKKAVPGQSARRKWECDRVKESARCTGECDRVKESARRTCECERVKESARRTSECEHVKESARRTWRVTATRSRPVCTSGVGGAHVWPGRGT